MWTPSSPETRNPSAVTVTVRTSSPRRRAGWCWRRPGRDDGGRGLDRVEFGGDRGDGGDVDHGGVGDGRGAEDAELPAAPAVPVL